MTVVHRSFFTGTNGVGADTLTPDVGSALLVPAGAFVVQDNRIYGSGTDNFSLTDQTLPADLSVSIIARRLTTGGATLWDLSARLNVFDSYFIRWTSGQLTLRKYIDPGPSVTLDTYSWTPSLNTDYTIELRCVGTSLEVYLDTVLVMAATDGDLTAAGDCGLASETASTSTTGWHFDTLIVDDLVVSSTQTIRPNATVSNTNWTANTTTLHGDTSDSSDTTFASASLAAAEMNLALADPSPSLSALTAGTLTIRARLS